MADLRTITTHTFIVNTHEVDSLYSPRVSRAISTFRIGDRLEVPPSLANREMLKLPAPRNGKVSLKVKETDNLLLPPIAITSAKGHSIRVPFSARRLHTVFCKL